MLAIVEAYRAGLLKPKNYFSNIIAGIIVGVVAIPLSMAFAIASGVKPEEGLYTAIIAGLLVGIFGGSRVQIAGPTGAFIVILADITARYGVSGLQIASLMAGFILLFMGLMKLGSVFKYIPEPVIVGFTAGIGFIIFTNEWKSFLGLPISLPLNAHFYQKIWVQIQMLPHLNIATTAMGILSLAAAILSPKFLKRIPGPLIAMLIATSLQMIFHFNDIATLGSAFGGIPNYLPQFHLPIVSFDQVLDLINPAFTIALLGAIESLLCASAADGMVGTRHNSNQELLGQGLANIVAPLFGGFASTGAIARTTTNIRNGGNSPIAAITHSIVLILVILFFAPLAAYIPLCTLAAILFIVAYNMSDIPHFIHILNHAPRYDILILVTTFLLTIFTNLVVGVSVGVILAMLFFIRQMSLVSGVEKETGKLLQNELKANGMDALPEGVLVYTIQGPFFFGAAEKIERALASTHADPKVIIFRLKAVPFMDMTGLETFKELIEQYHKRGVMIYLCESNSKVIKKLSEMGIIELAKDKCVFNTLNEVLNQISAYIKTPPIIVSKAGHQGDVTS